MPQILAIPAALLGATTGSIATGAGVGTGLSAFSALGGKLLGSLVLGGLSVGLSLLLRPPVPEPQSGSIETQQAVPPRTFVYGRMEIAGSIAFKEKPVGTGILFKIVLLHDGELDAWETLKLDDRIVVLDPVTGMVTNAFIQDGENRVWLWLHNGSDDQAADAEMLSNFPDIWTADHRLRGIAYVVCHFHGTGPENFLGAYPNGEPIFKAVIRGRRVYDPRDPAQLWADKTTWAWSDNPALCCLDWIAGHPKGYRIDPAKIDVPSFIIMANRCDELIWLTSGTHEKRYRVATQVSLKEPRTNVLARLREACDGHLYITGEGKWALRGGEWHAPDVTLDVSLGHILDLEMRDGMDALTRYNELSLRYLSPDHQYGEAECDPWQNTTDPEFVAGRVKTRQLDLLQVPSYTQARRLAKIMTAFDNPTYVGAATTNFYGLNAVGERNIQLNWSEAGEDIDGPFWVEPDLTLGENGATVTMSLRAADSTAYDWDPSTEEGEAVPLLPPVDLDFTEGTPPANPGDFAVTGGVRQAVASWTPPSDVAFYIARLWRADHRINALRSSQDAENSVWSKSVGIDAFGSGSVTNTTAVLDPLGGNTADFVRFNTNPDADSFQQITVAGSGVTPNVTNTYARWIKYQASGPEWVRIFMHDQAATANYVACYYNINAGTVGTTFNGGAGTGATGSIASRPDGWLLCILTGKPNTGAGTQVRIIERAVSSSSGTAYTGDGVHGYYIWRAQLEPGSVCHQPLIQTTTAAAAHNTFANSFEVSGPRYRPYHWPAPSMEPMTHTDPVKAGTYDYYLTVENPVGDRNTPVGPQHVTVT